MAYRLENASTYFVGTWISESSPFNADLSIDLPLAPRRTLIGYVVGTCSGTERLEHENMFKHDPHGSTFRLHPVEVILLQCILRLCTHRLPSDLAHLCVHSVLIAPKYQNRGYAKTSLHNYVAHITKEAPHIKRISLIAKESKTKLYESCGFKMIGKSSVVHGQDTWFELTMSLE